MSIMESLSKEEFKEVYLAFTLNTIDTETRLGYNSREAAEKRRIWKKMVTILLADTKEKAQ